MSCDPNTYQGTSIKDVRFFCDFRRYLPTYALYLSKYALYVLSIYVLCLIFLDIYTYLPKNRTSLMDVPLGNSILKLQHYCSGCGYK